MRAKIVTRALIGMLVTLVVGMREAGGFPTSQAPEAGSPAPAGADPRVTEGVDRLVEGLRRAPLLRPDGSDRFQLFVADVETGEATAIVDEPEKGRSHCGSPSWSVDGRRLLFDATPLDLWQLSRIESIGLVDGRPKVSDLGPGRFPSLSPDGRLVAFLLDPRADRPDSPGVWLKKADGSGRRWLGGPGRPLWSPDGSRLLIVGLGQSPELSVMEADGGESRPIKLAGRRIFPTPAWADDETLVAPIGAGAADAIALIDVSEPGRARVKEVLWNKRGGGPDVEPGDVAYCPEAARYAFVGAGPRGKALYTFRKGDAGPPRRIEPEGFDPNLGGLAFSPGGRYVVFHTDNPDRPQAPTPAAAEAPDGEVARLLATLRRDPVMRPGGSDRHRIFLMDLATGRSRPVADEPGRHLSFCGSISWSVDGRRILLDASPIGLFQVAHIKAIDLVDGRPKLSEYNPGNCPSLSPDGKRIAYLVNPGGDATEQQGVWLMRADGSDHRFLGGYGSPHWSPDGRRILIAGFSVPLDASIVDPETGQAQRIRFRDRTLHVAPEWAGRDALVALLGAEAADSVALIDVSDPGRAEVAEILWEKSNGPGVTPSDVVYDPLSGRCIFARARGRLGWPSTRAGRGKHGPARRLEAGGFDPMIADLALSPDGRYLLFRSNSRDRGPR